MLENSTSTNSLALGLNVYITVKGYLAKEDLKHTTINYNKADLLKLIAKHEELNLINDRLMHQNFSTKPYMYLTLQFFISKFFVKELPYQEFEKFEKPTTLPKTVKYFNLHDFLYVLNDILNTNFSIDRLYEEIKNYLTIEYSKKIKKLSSTKIKPQTRIRALDKKYELDLDLINLEQDFVSPKIFWLSLRFILDHKLKLEITKFEKKAKMMLVNNLSRDLNFYDVDYTVKCLNEFLTINPKLAS
ncbi:MAG: hypothetical protein K2Q03_02315 [Sphingobacteriaceae bacterium]|nr:hypothetical protein [Sphingobacteriaceae bacterium]